MRWLRYTIAFAVFAILFTGSMLVAASRTDALPDDSPVLFQTAPSAPGDSGLYKTALVVVYPDEARYYDMNAQYAFERVAGGLFPVEPGSAVPVSRFVAEWQTGAYEFSFREALRLPEGTDLGNCFGDVAIDPVQDPEGFSDAYQACGEGFAEAMEAWAEDFEETMQVAADSWVAAMGTDVQQSRGSDWHVTHHDGNDTVGLSVREIQARVLGSVAFGPGARWDDPSDVTVGPLHTFPGDAPGPCGWRSSLQQGPQDLHEPIWVQGDCPPNMELGFATITNVPGPIELVVSGKDTVEGKDAIVFSMPEDPDRLRLWFVEDRPYPVRVLTRADAVPEGLRASLGADWDEPRFYVMHDLVEYHAGIPTAPPKAVSLPLRSEPMGTAGPAVGDMEHPWPLEAALAAIRDPTNACAEEVAWLQQHPEAAADTGRSTVDDAAWTFRLSDDEASLSITVARTETDGLLGPEDSLECDSSEGEPAAVATGAAPTMGWTADLHETLTGTTPADYGFWRSCGCPGAMQWTLSDDAKLTVDTEGRFVALEQPADAYPDARFGPEGHDPDASTPWRYQASSGAFHMPEPATVATLAAGAGAASAAILLWPALKGLLGSVPLFSRIRSEDLLDNPVRQQIHDIVSAEPGVHFQAIVRRLEKGRGTTEHHIRKLVAGSLLVEKTQRGYTCYFPKGAIDRRLMEAAPVLKSQGAVQVMRAVIQQPGTASREIAESLGMSTSTVNYHVKKLMERGLITGERDGRFIRLHGTGLGEQALNQFAT